MVGNEAHSFQSQENEFPTYVTCRSYPATKLIFAGRSFVFVLFAWNIWNMNKQQPALDRVKGQIINGHFRNQFIGGNIPTIHMAKHMVRLRTSINWILEISH
jgi:hypothetical protein